jgi:hypothetical protein
MFQLCFRSTESGNLESEREKFRLIDMPFKWGDFMVAKIGLK